MWSDCQSGVHVWQACKDGGRHSEVQGGEAEHHCRSYDIHTRKKAVDAVFLLGLNVGLEEDSSKSNDQCFGDADRRHEIQQK